MTATSPPSDASRVVNAESSTLHGAAEYTCPMHSEVRKLVPGIAPSAA